MIILHLLLIASGGFVIRFAWKSWRETRAFQKTTNIDDPIQRRWFTAGVYGMMANLGLGLLLLGCVGLLNS